MDSLQIHNTRIQLYDDKGELYRTLAYDVEFAEFNKEHDIILCKYISGRVVVMNRDGIVVRNIAQSVKSVKMIDNTIYIEYINGKKGIFTCPTIDNYRDSMKYFDRLMDKYSKGSSKKRNDFWWIRKAFEDCIKGEIAKSEVN